jgi:hypothetical protein
VVSTAAVHTRLLCDGWQQWPRVSQANFAVETPRSAVQLNSVRAGGVCSLQPAEQATADDMDKASISQVTYRHGIEQSTHPTSSHKGEDLHVAKQPKSKSVSLKNTQSSLKKN